MRPLSKKKRPPSRATELNRVPMSCTQHGRQAQSAPSPPGGEGWGGGSRVWQRWCGYLTTPAPDPSPQGGGGLALASAHRRAIRVWLWAVAALLVLMVMVGGAT